VNWPLLPAIIITALDENSKTAVIKITKEPPIILYKYNTNENTHWVLGTKSINPSLKIPHNYIQVNNFTPLKKSLQSTKINNK